MSSYNQLMDVIRGNMCHSTPGALPPPTVSHADAWDNDLDSLSPRVQASNVSNTSLMNLHTWMNNHAVPLKSVSPPGFQHVLSPAKFSPLGLYVPTPSFLASHHLSIPKTESSPCIEMEMLLYMLISRDSYKCTVLYAA